MMTIDIYRGSDLFVSVKPDDNSVQSKTIMAENQLRLQFKMDHYVNFSINDYCVVYLEKYILNAPPTVRKVSKFLYEYSLTMDAEGSELARAQFLFLGDDNSLREPDFSLMGNAETFVDLILQNVARVSAGWTKGTIDSTDYKNLIFSKQNCAQALADVAKAFDTEFWILGKEIHVTKKQKDTGFVFKVGKNKGLYEITRQNVNNSGIVTRLYAFGSEKNLPPDYGSEKLLMPFGDELLISSLSCSIIFSGPDETFTFDWIAPTSPSVASVRIEYRSAVGPFSYQDGSVTTPRAITLPIEAYEFRFRSLDSSGNSLAVTPVVTITSAITTPIFATRIAYVEKNILTYGAIEDTEVFDDVYPHRTGTVTAVDAGNFYHFTDAAIDFDINTQLLPGLEAKVTFNTGQLAGYTFKIKSFNNSTKEFTILKNDDETALDIPNSLLKPAIGDKYVVVDIEMPDVYVQAAEQQLYDKALALLDVISQPQVSYSVVIDPVYLKRQNKTVSIGDLVWIVDNAMEIQRKIRITNTIRSILNEWQYQIVLSDVVTPGTIAGIIVNQITTQKDVNAVQQQVNNNSILNNNVIGDLHMIQGTIDFDSMPDTSTMTGFSNVVIEDATGKLYRKV